MMNLKDLFLDLLNLIFKGLAFTKLTVKMPYFLKQYMVSDRVFEGMKKPLKPTF